MSRWIHQLEDQIDSIKYRGRVSAARSLFFLITPIDIPDSRAPVNRSANDPISTHAFGQASHLRACMCTRHGCRVPITAQSINVRKHARLESQSGFRPALIGDVPSMQLPKRRRL